MKILNLSVNNFCGISGGHERNTVNFDGSNTIFILGQNNVGKSSFLRAYKVFYDDEKLERDDFYCKEVSNTVEMILEVELTEEEKEEFADKRQNAEDKYFYGSDNNRLKIKKVWGAEGKAADNFTLHKDQSGFDNVGYAGVGGHNFFKPRLPKPIFIKAMPSEGDLEEIVNDILSSKVKEILKAPELEEYKQAAQKIKELQQKVYNRDDVRTYRDNVNSHFSSLFREMRIAIGEKDPETVLKSIDKKFTINFEQFNSDGSTKEHLPVSFQSIGHGAIRMAIFSLFLMRDYGESTSGTKEFLVLFEEPELFLHPSLTKQLRKLIYEVTGDDKPFQLLCASHSPQMIDLTRPKTSLVRMERVADGTNLYQIDESLLTESDHSIKQELYEGLRFNPYICEAFYADEVVLVEGDTEAVILRAYLQQNEGGKDLFILNCGTVNNIPFFQKVFTKFNIRHHVICDTDGNGTGKMDEKLNPIMESGIQGSIYKCVLATYELSNYKAGLLRTHEGNFEEAHRAITTSDLAFPYDETAIIRDGKPYCANQYWNERIGINLNHPQIGDVPIVRFIREILLS